MIAILSKLFGEPKKKENKVRHGKWKEFNRFGIMIAEGVYKNGLREGTWKLYSDLGQLVIEEDYVHGVLHGSYKAFYENGRPISVGTYAQNKRQGEFLIYDEDGILNRVLQFDNGELKDVREIHNENKALSA